MPIKMMLERLALKIFVEGNANKGLTLGLGMFCSGVDILALPEYIEISEYLNKK